MCVCLCLQLRQNTQYCYDVVARRDKIVTNLKPSNAVIYDYYKPGKRAMTG